MMQSVKDLIRSRRSVRTFDGRPLADADREKLERFLNAPTNPFGVPISFRILDAKENGLSSPVIVGADTYLAAKVARVDHHEIAYGYSFEHACLSALSLGLGTVMLAASLSRSAFEKAMDVQPDEVMPVASPIGYPAEKHSIRETLMRKGLKADERLPFETLFFEGSFEKRHARGEGQFDEALEMARWAPSAGNQQPWRAVIDGNTVHFFEKRSMKVSALGDIQKLDVGIALCHFDLTMREAGKPGSFVFRDPQIPCPDNTSYVVSYEAAP